MAGRPAVGLPASASPTASRSWPTATSRSTGPSPAIDGDQATFTVNESFIGDLTGSVTLTAPVSSEDIAFEGGTELVQGERYLVSGDDGIVWGCGFTQPYSDTLAAEWATAG